MSNITIWGIGGIPGSGKSTLSDGIKKSIEDQVAIISLDSYYKDQSGKTWEEKVKTNYDRIEALDTKLLIHDLKKLKEGKTVNIPCYDMVTHDRLEETQRVDPKPLICIEGFLVSVIPGVKDILDLLIFLDIKIEKAILRRIRRDMEIRGREPMKILKRIEENVIPCIYNQILPSKENADIIISGEKGRKIIVQIVSYIYNSGR